MDDNWGRLYQAILDFNEPLSVITNALEFQEDVPTSPNLAVARLRLHFLTILTEVSHSQLLAAARHQSPSLGSPQSTLHFSF